MATKPKTPEEVIKALEVCLSPGTCDECLYYDCETERCNGRERDADALRLLVAAYGKHGLIQQLREALARCQEGNNS